MFLSTFLRIFAVCMAPLCYSFTTPYRPPTPTVLQVATFEPLDEATELMAMPDGWQHDVDQLLMIDTPCATKRKNIIALLTRSRAIVGDVAMAVRTRDLNRVAPSDLAYGKAVLGLAALRRQFFSDIVPGSITKGIPRLVRESPAMVRGAFRLLRSLPRRGRRAVGYVGEVVQDPSMLQYTLDTLKKEVKNTFKPMPQGIYSPPYDVVSAGALYQVRAYRPYAVCQAALTGGEGNEMADPFAMGASFGALAGYIFNDAQFYMSTPVICGEGAMQFVLPRGVTAANAPPAASPLVSFRDVPAETVAVREFQGFATDGEVSRQRAMLEDALLADGVAYDNLSFKVFQFNPPQTLPWLRKNEVVVKVDVPSVPP